MAQPRMTLPTQQVLRVLLADTSSECYGLQIGEDAGCPRGLSIRSWRGSSASGG